MKIRDYVKNCEFQTDELGRMIITNMDLLNKVNGSLFGDPDFMIADTACGNDNCVC